MIVAFVQMNIVRSEFRLQQFLRMSIYAGAVHVHPSICAFEGRAVAGCSPVAFLPLVRIGITCEIHRHAAFVFAGDFPVHCRVCYSFGRPDAFAFNLHRAGHFFTAAPQRDIQRMNTPAGDETESIIRNEPPQTVRAAVLRIRRKRCRPKPHLVIEPFRHGHRGRVAALAAAGRPYVNSVQFAEPAVQRKLAGETEIAAGTLLCAELENSAVSVHCCTKGLVLGRLKPIGFSR